MLISREEFAYFVFNRTDRTEDEAARNNGHVRVGKYGVKQLVGLVPVDEVVFSVDLDTQTLLHAEQPAEEIVHGGTDHNIDLLYAGREMLSITFGPSDHVGVGIAEGDDPIELHEALRIATQVVTALRDLDDSRKLVPQPQMIPEPTEA